MAACSTPKPSGLGTARRSGVRDRRPDRHGSARRRCSPISFTASKARLDGRPTLLIVDEGWLALDDEGFAGQLREWLKTLRKKNASVVFATQSLSDIDGVRHRAGHHRELPDAGCSLPNERAIEPQITAIYRRFGLNDRADRDPRPRDAEAGLLLPVAARQPVCSNSVSARSRSPSLRPRPSPIRLRSRRYSPNTAARALRPPG